MSPPTPEDVTASLSDIPIKNPSVRDNKSEAVQKFVNEQFAESHPGFLGVPQLAGPISGEKDLRTGKNINTNLLNILP